jgi:hypothetical protein
MRTSIGTKQKIKPEYYTQTQSCVWGAIPSNHVKDKKLYS